MHRPAVLLVFAALAVTVTVGVATGASTATDGNETVLTAEIEGTTATNVSILDNEYDEIRSTIASELGVDERTVRISERTETIEVGASNVSKPALRDALRAASVNASGATLREGVTVQTQSKTVRIIDERLSKAGIDATVEKMTADDGTRGVRIETTNVDSTAVVSNLTFQGQVEMVAHFPIERDGDTVYRDVTLLTNADFVNVGSVQPASHTQPNPFVPVTLTDEAAQNFSDAMVNFGFTSPEGIANCPTQTAEQDSANATGHCLYTVSDGEVVYAAQMSRGLAQEFENGGFAANPQFVITAENTSEARNLALALRAGALPAPLDFDALPDEGVQNATPENSTESNETETPSSGDGAGFTAVTALAVVLTLGAVGARSRSN